jgi:Na+-driven multidrug efflux pump
MKILFKYQKNILILAALFNLIGGTIALASPSFFFSQFFRNPPDPETTFPYLSMYHYTFFSVVFIFGVAYWMTALDPSRNRVILFVGAFGKLVAVAMWIMMYCLHYGKWGMLAAVFEDGIMGLIMLVLFFGKTPEKVEELES